jgi:signal-transduction protein with cAMP-binding, CBS, and nucleotidyltransferase domain
MTLSEKIFALKAVSPFHLLRDSELALIAQEARVRRYAGSEVIADADKPLRKVHVVIEGSVRHAGDGGVPVPVFGVKALLFNAGADEAISASDEGATCLQIRRGNFFTIANECPGLLVGFVEMAERKTLL